MKIETPELLSPAGDWPSLHAAIESGADSVYFGVKGINMRHMASNFEILEIKKIIKFLHAAGKKGYLTLNTVLMQSDLKRVEKICKEAQKSNVDAVILWDMAALNLAQKYELNIHLSTQASVASASAAQAYALLGVKRIVLARECTLEDIIAIKKQLKKMSVPLEIEAFIHGAMCVSVSGRCFLSLEAFGKSANKGQCLQPCRRQFQIKDVDGESEYILGQDYVLSPKDLCSIEFLDLLMKAGIDSFKIEGRMRSPEYVKVATGVYRQAIDTYADKQCYQPQQKQRWLEQLQTVYNRGFSHGFYFGAPFKAISRELEHTHHKIYLGEVTRFFKKIQVAEIRLRTQDLKVGQELLFIGLKTPAIQVRVEEMQQDNHGIEVGKKGSSVGVKLSVNVRPKDKVFIWEKK